MCIFLQVRVCDAAHLRLMMMVVVALVLLSFGRKRQEHAKAHALRSSVIVCRP